MKRLWKRCVDYLARRITAGIVNCDYMIQQADVADRQLLLTGRQACRQISNVHTIKTFEDIEFRVFSQWGEDGIIEWLIQNLGIEHKSFVEFGVESFREANTRFLIENRNWKGLVMDGNEANICALQASKLYYMYDLTAATEFITGENINQLISKYGFSGNLGILSIDIDGNDYWVWESINCVNPSFIICEFNPNFGDVFPIVIPYNPVFERFKTHYSGMYYGASIVALKMLGEKKGYVFLGTNSNGVNAFFVRKDLFAQLKHFPEPKVYPALHRDSRNENGSFNYYDQLKKHNEIKHLPVVRVDTGERVILESLNMLYSKAWLDGTPSSI